MASLEILAGVGENNFAPNQTITRGEVTAIVNHMLGRSVDTDYVNAHTAELTQFNDVNQTHWAYYNIIEATNALKASEDGQNV